MKNGKKYLRKLTAAGMAAIMTASMGASAIYAADSTDKVYNYENKYLWYVPTENFTWDNQYSCLADHHRLMGGTAADGTEFDFDALVNSPLGEDLVTSMKNFILHDEYSAEEYEYWENLGIRKEVHDSTDRNSKWSTFTPMEAYEEENADKKYPVLFVFHGGSNTVFATESYGYAQMAAKEGFICVMPYASNGGSADEEEGTTLDAEVDRIMETLRAEYPIDESRIYAAGYSLGGRSTVRETIKHPNMFASVTVGGHDLGGIRQGNDYVFTDEEWDALEETPILQLDGDNEMRLKLPYGYSVTEDIATTALNRWFKINGIDREVTFEECKEIADTSEDTAQRKIGLDADDIYTQYYDGTEFYTADFKNADDVTMIKVINVEGMIHWMTQSMAQVAWNFMSQYARDTETGELVVLNQDDKPQLEPEDTDYNKTGSFIQDYTKEIEKDSEVTITVKASADVQEYKLTLEDGTELALNSDRQDGEDGYSDWTLTAAVGQTGKVRLYLVPVTEDGEQDALEVPVLVQ